jgi:hypothetical protein
MLPAPARPARATGRRAGPTCRRNRRIALDRPARAQPRHHQGTDTQETILRTSKERHKHGRRLDRSQGRAAQETQRRRRRGDDALAATKRLPIPPEVEAELKAKGLSAPLGQRPRQPDASLHGAGRLRPVEGSSPCLSGLTKPVSPSWPTCSRSLKEFIREDREKADKRLKGD